MFNQPLLMGGGIEGRVRLQAISAGFVGTPAVGRTATITFLSSGDVQATNSVSGVTDSYTWKILGSASDYEIKVENDGPDTPFGDSIGVWLGLGASRSWYFTVNGIAYRESTLDVSIRLAASPGSVKTLDDSTMISIDTT